MCRELGIVIGWSEYEREMDRELRGVRRWSECEMKRGRDLGEMDRELRSQEDGVSVRGRYLGDRVRMRKRWMETLG